MPTEPDGIIANREKTLMFGLDPAGDRTYYRFTGCIHDPRICSRLTATRFGMTLANGRLTLNPITPDPMVLLLLVAGFGWPACTRESYALQRHSHQH
jgi:hypothetical protein